MTARVLFWFDVEDYVEPQSDAALKGLLEAFEANGVQATWKLVGEKARALERRGRSDIIRLIQRQDIGYHTDYHSRHPVLAEYLELSLYVPDTIRKAPRQTAPAGRFLSALRGPQAQPPAETAASRRPTRQILRLTPQPLPYSTRSTD